LTRKNEVFSKKKFSFQEDFPIITSPHIEAPDSGMGRHRHSKEKNIQGS